MYHFVKTSSNPFDRMVEDFSGADSELTIVKKSTATKTVSPVTTTSTSPTKSSTLPTTQPVQISSPLTTTSYLPPKSKSVGGTISAPTATFAPNPYFPTAPVVPVVPIAVTPAPAIGGGGAGGGGGAPSSGQEGEGGGGAKQAESHTTAYIISGLAGAVAGYFGTANYKKGIYADKKWWGAIIGGSVVLGGAYAYYNYFKK